MLTVHQLAERIARWHETHLLVFECCGAWITNSVDPAMKPVWASLAQQHRWHAELWAGRFPVVPGLDLAAASREARSNLDATSAALCSAVSTTERVTVLAEAALATLIAEYHDASGEIDPALDAPTARILDQVLADLNVQLGLLAEMVEPIRSQS